MLLRPHRSLRCATESCFSIRGNRENEFASFQGLRHGNLAISSQQSRQKTTLAQWVRNSSRATLELEKLTFDAHPTELLPEQTRPATGPDLEKSHRLPGYGIIPRRG